MIERLAAAYTQVMPGPSSDVPLYLEWLDESTTCMHEDWWLAWGYLHACAIALEHRGNLSELHHRLIEEGGQHG